MGRARAEAASTLVMWLKLEVGRQHNQFVANAELGE